MRTRWFLPILILLCSIVAYSQTSSPSDPTIQRLNRLTDLARVWGAVKFFHPYLAYRDIDWDKALVETIPKVNAAKSTDEYVAALNDMLSALGDKNTFSEIQFGAKTENTNSTATPTEPSSFEAGVLTIRIAELSKRFAGGAGVAAANQLVAKSLEKLPEAKTIIIDMRFPAKLDAELSYYSTEILRMAVPQIVDRPFSLSSTRYRIHNGYESQAGSGYSGYESALVTSAAVTLTGNNKSKTPPVILLINEHSPNADIVGGLRSARVALVIQDGASERKPGMIGTTIDLSENVQFRMRTAELVNSDGSLGVTPDKTSDLGASENLAKRIIAENDFGFSASNTENSYSAPISRKDRRYGDMTFPDKEHRLLALFRFWNVINYFFPYKDLIGTAWNEIPGKYIPLFEANKDAADYRFTVGKMVAEIRDSHGFVRFPPLTNSTPNYFPPIKEAFAENKTYVRAVLDEKSGFRPGDVVMEVDGEPISKLLEKFTVRIAASTPQALMRNAHNFGIFRGPKDSKVTFKVLGIDGKTRNVQTSRTLAADDPRLVAARSTERKTPVVSILPSGFGYVDLDRLTNDEVDKMFETIKDTPATIFDMRGYPNGTAWSVAPRLTTKKNPVGALFSRPQPEAPSFNEDMSLSYSFIQKLPSSNGSVYSGKIVMLIDETAISQSEHTALFFEAARPDITFIGTPTAGANGDVTFMVLPGSIEVAFSGHSVRHADGRQLQRVGILPTIKVSPTIKGLVNSKDEILEAAVKFLRSRNAKK